MILKVALVFAGFSASLLAQSFATLTGSVADSSGAMVPRAAITIVNEATGETWNTSSNDSGLYTIPLVKPGTYRLTAEAAGFKQYRHQGILLETGVATRVDVNLTLGQLTESVEVTATAPQLKSESSAVEGVITNNMIANMPLLGRRAAQLTRLQGFLVQTSGTNFTVAGGRGGANMWKVDGGIAQNLTFGVTTLAFDPPVESLQEFKVSVSNYAAELGRAGGGVIEMTTRSGTNRLHGSAYEYLRNDVLNARSFFATSMSALRYNLFGASIAGPFRRDKAFYFVNYEGLRQIDSRPVFQNVPDPPETRGDFSAVSRVVRDPAAAGRPPFPGNIVPASRFDPVGAKIAAWYPAPNVAGRASRAANLYAVNRTQTSSDGFVGRFDHNLSDTHRLYGRYGGTPINPIRPSPIWADPATDSTWVPADALYHNVSAAWMANVTPRTINEFRFAFDYRTYVNGAGKQGGAGRIGLKGVDPQYSPMVSLSGLQSLGNTRGQTIQRPMWNRVFSDSATLIRGNHTIKFGGEYRYVFMNQENIYRPAGNFAFNEVATGDSLAALLLGWTASAGIDVYNVVAMRGDTYAAFVQDDWKVTPKLTLNLGLRWDMDQPRLETGNRQNSFDRTAINPVCNCPGVVTFAGRDGTSRYANNWDPNNFGPRFGFAWRAANNWVVRGGAALLYMGTYNAWASSSATTGFAQGQLSYNSPDNGLTPVLLLANGFPAWKEVTDADRTPGFGAVPIGSSPRTSVQFFDKDRRTGYLETLNLNIQRQLPWQTLVEIGYLGTFGHKLGGANPMSINQVPAALMGPGNAQVRRPFPQFSEVAVQAPSVGNSNYHGLNLKIEKRMSSGIQFQTDYTWSRLIDDIVAQYEFGGSAAGGYFNNYDLTRNRDVGGSSIKHRLIGSVVYDLPVGAGRRWDGGKIGNQFIGGWTFGLIAEVRSGAPFGVVEQVNNTGSFSPSNRPNVIGNAALPGGRPKDEFLTQWFNTSAFAAPAPYTFGNAGRMVAYGPGAVNLDLSLLKDFSIMEGHRVQFRLEMINFPNHASFGMPVTTRGNAAFGRITGASAGRVVQFGLHYRF